MRLVFTIGHSTRTLDELLGLLRACGIRCLVDVRRFPGSRRHPHFAKAALTAALTAEGIHYLHEPDLGGRRLARPDSPHTAWKHPAFRGYADHMAAPAFAIALARLVEHALDMPTAIMCAEAVPWRCHRQLIADALVARGVEVRHILDAKRTEKHVLHPSARVQDDGTLLYATEPPLFTA